MQGLTEGATHVEKLDIPLGSARPGVDTPIEQHVDGLSHFPGARFCAGIVGGEDILGTSVPVRTIKNMGLRCKRNKWSSKWGSKTFVVKYDEGFEENEYSYRRVGGRLCGHDHS